MPERKDLKVLECDGCRKREVVARFEGWPWLEGTARDNTCGEKGKWIACSLNCVEVAVYKAIQRKD